jgi:RNA polymerase sigma factor (TIGR02999 family)
MVQATAPTGGDRCRLISTSEIEGPRPSKKERKTVEQSGTPLSVMLQSAAKGDRRAAEEILPLVYDELRRLAQTYLANAPPGNSLQATALVHEAYMRLVGDEDPGWEGRRHFFGAAANAMRNILVEQARRKGTLKRGAGQQRLDVQDADIPDEALSDNVVALHEALTGLEKADPRKAEIVMLRHFAGLSMEETAAAMGVSLSTVEREWRFTRALLYSQLMDGDKAS